jgi:MFS family permease
MSDLSKIKISQVISSCQFWMVTFVLYMTTLRGFSLEQTFQLLGIFSISIVILEYPTGVMGDHFSHRLSNILGYFLYAIGFFLLSFPGSFYFYAFALFFGALAAALVSGSDTSFLHYASSNFKKDSSDVQMYSIAMSVFSISVGGYFSSFDLRIPFYLTSFFFFVAALILLSISRQKKDNFTGNIFARSLEGIRHTRENKLLSHIMILSALLGAFFLSFKWFYNPLFIDLKINLVYWGLIISFTTFLIAVGTYFYKRSKSDNIAIPFLLIIGATFFIGFTKFATISIAALIISQFVRGYIDNQLNVELNNAISISSRASILSLKSLLVRLFSSLYIFGAGLVLERTSFFILMTLTAGMLLITCTVPIMQIITIRKKIMATPERAG